MRIDFGAVTALLLAGLIPTLAIGGRFAQPRDELLGGLLHRPTREIGTGALDQRRDRGGQRVGIAADVFDPLDHVVGLAEMPEQLKDLLDHVERGLRRSIGGQGERLQSRTPLVPPLRGLLLGSHGLRLGGG